MSGGRRLPFFLCGLLGRTTQVRYNSMEVIQERNVVYSNTLAVIT